MRVLWTSMLEARRASLKELQNQGWQESKLLIVVFRSARTLLSTDGSRLSHCYFQSKANATSSLPEEVSSEANAM